DNIVRTFAKHPTGTSIRALTLVTLPTLLLYALNRDDEEYQELDSWEKDMNWMIPMGGWEFVKIPITVK
ncbi:LPD38 domain-containing protein, partial [Lysinibacillus fusiformis]|uniref:LPD38 domain-containing protein n=1 Tax=Lysinibacillus fusiformis TaxID=28031 RepID=UPI0020C129B3